MCFVSLNVVSWVTNKIHETNLCRWANMSLLIYNAVYLHVHKLLKLCLFEQSGAHIGKYKVLCCCMGIPSLVTMKPF